MMTVGDLTTVRFLRHLTPDFDICYFISIYSSFYEARALMTHAYFIVVAVSLKQSQSLEFFS